MKMRKRMVYIDYLRIISIFAVIMIHVSAENWYTNNIDMNWLLNNFMNSLVCWPVSLFVVISGSLHLTNDNFTIKNMFLKYIPRILICLIFWHFVYYFWFNPNFSLNNFIICIKKLLLGKSYSHLWYLYMLIGLYLLTPILVKLVKKLTKQEILYILILGFFITSLLPTIKLLFNVDLNNFILPYKVLTFNIFVFYYLLGYYLYKYDVYKPKLLLFISIICLIISGIVSGYKAYNLSMAFSYSSNTNLISLLTVISIYSFFKEKKLKDNKKISQIGKLIFGVYLVHFLIEKILLEFNIDAYIMNPILGVIFVSVIIFSLSLLFSYIMSKIPILRKVIT